MDAMEDLVKAYEELQNGSFIKGCANACGTPVTAIKSLTIKGKIRKYYKSEAPLYKMICSNAES